ncbi:prohead protease/major capsid protein fusion protein [Ruminiclostridium herbifermentans]|uniref:prohead protease/major capsid protein fusion protein n=1 Tax=Ruminiclostridium herbifermentans TaxID=2488810 RepID=UPI001FD42CE8|nr:prohead protease/major capsid protein fusion protein [Ruminiclostridium herbifermentans]
MPKTKKPKPGLQMKRTVDIAIREIKDEERRVRISFSSEQPVRRWFGQEILCHDAGSIDMTRINTIGVALWNHNKDVVIGRIENAVCNDAEKKTYADIIFDTDEESERIYQKVKSGTLKGVSVGYSVDVWEEVAPNKLSSNGRFVGPCEVATRWSPYEISIVSVPADDSVGVGRDFFESESAYGRNDNTNMEDDENMRRKRNSPMFAPDEGGGAGTHEQSATREQPQGSEDLQRAIQMERQRVSDITALCREFEVSPDEYVREGFSMDQVRAKVLESLKEQRTPKNASREINIEVTKEEADKVREAASDGLILRAGMSVEKPAEGARDFRGMTLRDIAIDCLQRSGVVNAHRWDSERLFREALSPDGQFASIMSNTVNKSMATAYKAQNTTYQVWTKKGSNPDFKAATVYQISEAGDLEKMTQSGEFKMDEMSDNGVTKALATFGKKFGISRQAFINDDIGVLTKIPEAYVRAAGRGINTLVYKMIGSNPTIYDGVTLFHANHKNIGTPGTIGTATVGEARKLMRKQKNIRGKETLNIAPKFLITPAEKETEAAQFLNSIADPSGNNSGVANVFRNSLNLVVDAELDTYSISAYYFAADPGDIDTIEVTYLNGDDMPKLESRIGFDFLGMEWRIYIDYGVNILDYRGLSKNAGQ